MGLLLAAVGAAVAALLESTIASRIQVAGAPIEIVLVFAIVLTIALGFEEGMAWAFVGGLSLDLITIRPLGSTVFVLMAAVGLAALVRQPLSRSRWLGPILGTLVLTVIYLVLTQIVMTVLHNSVPPLKPGPVVTTAVVNAGLAVIVAPPFVAWRKRSENRERVVW